MTTLGFTRPSKRIKDSVAQAEAMGFQALGAPSLDILPGEDAEFSKLQESVSGDCIAVFCSVTAVEDCQSRYKDSFRGMFDGTEVVSIGPATTSKLKAAGIEPDTVPEEYSSEGIVEALKGRVSGKRVVLIRSDSGSDVLSEGLDAAGADVRDIAVYRLKDAGESIALLHLLTMIKQGRLDVMAFTSPMSASMFVSRVEQRYGKEKGSEYLHGVKIAAIGGPTSRRLEELGFPPDIVPEKATFADMLEAIRGAFPE